MANAVSHFFSSLMPSYRTASTPAPTHLSSETRTVGSASPAPTATTPARAEATAASAPTGSSAASSSSTSGPDATSPEELRNLRAQFLDKQFGQQGKRKGAKGKGLGVPKSDPTLKFQS
ncbi:Uu.00g095940.m01.CDS01 [Anthostomella pinea]|uniref:Uu.00g095940.m01.CDS01 n=1 Tax=Anthostomella pinea TaxID=933095 RepID=A0AAI8YEW1_9PEZI|nr:Uu.00g095940.m01.CDS01 [Anthostomella pinea]